jgi:hypothetical protein
VRDLVFLVAFASSGVGLWWLHCRFKVWEAFILAAVSLLEWDEPEPEPTRPLAVAGLKQWQVGWGREMRPVSRPSTRAQAAYS